MSSSPGSGATAFSARDGRLYPSRSSRLYAVLTGLRRNLERLLAQDLKLQPGQILLDYGCGNTPYRPLFERHGVKYLGADFAKNDYATVVIDRDGRVAMGDCSCDLVLSTQVLEHVSSPELYLAECRRMLRAGGHLVCSTHGYWKYHPDPRDLWRWTGDGLCQQVEQAGFEVLHIRGVLGLGGAGLQLLQDALGPRLWHPLAPLFYFVLQGCILVVDRLHSEADRRKEAILLMVLARKR